MGTMPSSEQVRFIDSLLSHYIAQNKAEVNWDKTGGYLIDVNKPTVGMEVHALDSNLSLN